jgi:hypothetical protein
MSEYRYTAQLLLDGKVIESRDLGTWRDHAVERYASACRKAEQFYYPEPMALQLVRGEELIYRDELGKRESNHAED